MSATEVDIHAVMLEIAARFPGTIPAPTADLWSRDLEQYGFEVSDVREAGSKLVNVIMDTERAFAIRGRPQLADIVTLAQSVRDRRRTREAQALERKQLGAGGGTTLHRRTNALMARWMGRAVVEHRVCGEQETLDRVLALEAVIREAEQARVELTDEQVELELRWRLERKAANR